MVHQPVNPEEVARAVSARLRVYVATSERAIKAGRISDNGYVFLSQEKFEPGTF